MKKESTPLIKFTSDTKLKGDKSMSDQNGKYCDKLAKWSKVNRIQFSKSKDKVLH